MGNKTNQGDNGKRGYDEPNHTQVPNALIALMPVMSEAELRVTLAIVRKTYGWHKREDKLSYSQLMELTGLSRQGVSDGLDAGMERGTITRTEAGNSFSYSLVVNPIEQSDEDSLPSRPKTVYPVETQKKEIKVQEEAAPAENVYSLYQTTFGDLIANPQGTKTQIYIESLQAMPLDWVRESFARTVKKERASGEVWRDYRRLPYALQIAGEWKKAGRILPEQTYATKPTYSRGPSKPAAPGYTPPTEAERAAFHARLANAP